MGAANDNVVFDAMVVFVIGNNEIGSGKVGVIQWKFPLLNLGFQFCNVCFHIDMYLKNYSSFVCSEGAITTTS
jgi:hypothetical protein